MIQASLKVSTIYSETYRKIAYFRGDVISYVRCEDLERCFITEATHIQTHSGGIRPASYTDCFRQLSRKSNTTPLHLIKHELSATNALKGGLSPDDDGLPHCCSYNSC